MPKGRPKKKLHNQDFVPKDQLTEEDLAVRGRAENDLLYFINLVHPNRVLGHVHKDLIRWWTRDKAKSHQLVLLPRDHQKSALLAYRVAWTITRNPAIRILYISSTSNLASKQLKFIKDILTSDTYMRYWPEMVNKEESKREKWTETEISVDHPIRKQEVVRDPTVFIAGLTTGIVGLHCDVAALDDVVVNNTAETKEGREKVKTQISYLASIGGAEAKQWAVGTRYHPQDLYQDFMETTYDEYDDKGSSIGTHYLYEVYEAQVEDGGDGTGQFLWPRQRRKDGKWFGFDQNILARKKSQYHDLHKFRAQYYNDPNDLANAAINSDMFQYYDKGLLKEQGNGNWTFNGRRLNLHASVDFAFSTSKQADYTCIVVLGVDSQHNYYILEIERFKTGKISDYFDKILKLYTKWGFRKLTAETSVAQKVIVDDLRLNYIRPHGLALTVHDARPVRSKEERIQANLQNKYENLQMWHYQGGNCELLEEELVLQKPPHDDIKDALSMCVENSIPPSGGFQGVGLGNNRSGEHGYLRATDVMHSRFGGIG